MIMSVPRIGGTQQAGDTRRLPRHHTSATWSGVMTDAAGLTIESAMLEAIRETAELYVCSVSPPVRGELDALLERALRRLKDKLNGGRESAAIGFVDELLASEFSRQVAKVTAEAIEKNVCAQFGKQINSEVAAKIAEHIESGAGFEKVAESIDRNVAQSVAAYIGPNETKIKAAAEQISAYRMWRRGIPATDIAATLKTNSARVKRLVSGAEKRVAALKAELKAFEKS